MTRNRTQTNSNMSASALQGKTTRFWNVVDLDDDTGIIELTGDVVSEVPISWWTDEPIPGNYITPEGFKEDLELVKDKKNIQIRINSCGGDLYSGIAIHNAIADLKANKTVIVDGIAASAASVIACQKDAEVMIYPGSMIMIHGAACMVWDYMTAEDSEKITRSLKAANRAIAQIYNERTGTSMETLLNMMTKETWMVGQEAIDKGFADTLLGAETEPEMELSADHKVLMVAGVRHDVSAFHIPVNKLIRPADKAVGNTEKPSGNGGTTQGGTKPMPITLDELRAQEPDLVSQIEADAVSAHAEESRQAVADAVQAERDRIREIDEIADSIGDRTLVNEAKYGETPMNAHDLAFEAVKRAREAGANFITQMNNDADASGANDVPADPNGGPEVDEVEEQSDEEIVNKAVEVYRKMKGVKGNG